MSNPISAQTDLLSEIVRFIYDSSPPEFEDAICIFEYFREEDGSWSVGSQFSYTAKEKNVGGYLNDPNDKVSNLVAKLHDEMQAHTGGDWRSFNLSIKNGGAATVKFQYS